eukprot:CAMPEP_0202703890 /NCGR_PEP_ID=MMETSP1385-20130828/16681_1 /ASSEMBLY_ACC=CAM_ASM_000861 /TAXON_ID=933848 /ORGANISM="Elphidium margaritaceum" /LENGTH=358 /DNA_ID=CAMNT_0049361811 /DNA_START=33 /DNA_END=1109 /DNA_ORIENTATION=-
MASRYSLVRNKEVDVDDDVYGMYYKNGKLVVSIPAGWLVRCLKAWVILNMFLAFWTSFFPDVSMVYSCWWMMCPLAIYAAIYVLLYLNAWYNSTFHPVAFTRLPFMLIVALAAYAFAILKNRDDINDLTAKVLDHEMWLQHLQRSVDVLEGTVEVLDDRFTTWTKKADERYTKFLAETEKMQKVEQLASKMWEGFGLITVTRQHFGLGCFVEGTLIQVDEHGNVKPIETLNEHDTIWNPDLAQAMKIRVLTIGPEDGFIYKFVTNESLSVSVTKTHPMKICDEQCGNMAAADVLVGDLTQTVYGLQEIVAIDKVQASNATVYNIMLDMNADNSSAHHQRSMVANHIHTFDLYVQAMNE